jgi:hypothetical protein
MSEIIGSVANPDAKTRHALKSSDRRSWNYNGALSRYGTRARAVARHHRDSKTES